MNLSMPMDLLAPTGNLLLWLPLHRNPSAWWKKKSLYYLRFECSLVVNFPSYINQTFVFWLLKWSISIKRVKKRAKKRDYKVLFLFYYFSVSLWPYQCIYLQIHEEKFTIQNGFLQQIEWIKMNNFLLEHLVVILSNFSNLWA